MNKQLSLLDLLTEKDQKSVPIPIQHEHTFPYFENKCNLVFHENLIRKLIES